MEELEKVMDLFESHQKNSRRYFFITMGLLVGISVFVSLDLFRVNPFIFYLIGMALMLTLLIKTKDVSRNYDRMSRYIKKNHKELRKDKKFMFYLDYQLNKAYKNNDEELKKALSLKNKKMDRRIEEINFLYQSLLANSSIEELEF